jgi:dihydroflavonol-4-reductase
VAKVLVTGGTGFIGAWVARELCARGDEVRIASRTGAVPQTLADLDLDVVACDIRDRVAVRKALKRVERVFHAAGVTSLRAADRARCFDVNVRGTKTVLEECLRAGVGRVVYTSSSAAVGPAEPHGAADETQLFTAGRLGIAYVNSKHEAEAEAMRLAARGLPLVCVNPTLVLGPGDLGGSSASLVRRFMLRRIPLYVSGGLNIVDVRDVARAHLLADQRGKVGERYLLAGRNYTWDRLFADLSRLSGVAPPALRLPAAVGLRLADAAAVSPLRTALSVDEMRSAGQWWTYKSTKAGRELRWKARPHEETLEATVAWWMERDRTRIAAAQAERGARDRALDLALGGAGATLRLAARARRMVAA